MSEPVHPTEPPSSSVPLISVIVPLHDVAAYAADAIASLRLQSHSRFEALVIDDGSQDSSGAVAEAAFADDPRFTLIRQENRGLGAARNAGIARARGEWLAFLDGDDTFEPAALETLLQAALAAGTDWAGGAITLTYPDGHAEPHSTRHDAPRPEPGTPAVQDLGRAADVAQLFPSAWNKLYHRRLFAGLRYPEGLWFEDHEPFWRMARRAPRIAMTPAPVYRHRRERPGQITATDSDRVFELFAVLDRLRPVIESWPDGVEVMARHSSRLISERLDALSEPGRRARFLAAAQAWLQAAGLTYSAGESPEIARSPGLVMAGEAPLGVILLVSGTNDAALAHSRAAIQAVLRPEFEYLEAERGSGGLEAALTQSRARYLLLLREGELLLPGAAERLAEAGLWRAAPMVLGGFYLRQTSGAQLYSDGWQDPAAAPKPPEALNPFGEPVSLTLERQSALRLLPARMALERAFLARILPAGADPADPLLPTRIMLRALDRLEGEMMLLGHPLVEIPGEAAEEIPTEIPEEASEVVAARPRTDPRLWAALLPDAGARAPALARSLLEIWLEAPQSGGLAFELALRRAGLRIASDDPLWPRMTRRLRLLLR